jgi:hypothetical protein
VGLPVRLMLLLELAGRAFAVGGPVSLLSGELVGLLRPLGLLTDAGQVAAAQEPGGAVLRQGDQAAGLLAATGRLL